MNLLHLFVRYDVVIIIDAVNFNGKTGKNHRYDNIKAYVKSVTFHNLFNNPNQIPHGEEYCQCKKPHYRGQTDRQHGTDGVG